MDKGGGDKKEDKLKCNTEKDKNMRLNHRTAGK